jgi:chemotaxis methyl-accepting protein methylase
MNSDLDRVFSIFQQACRQEMSVFPRVFLTRALEKRMTAKGMATLAEYGDFLAENPAECEIFYRSLMVQYSEFFRDPYIFALLAHQVLPALLQQKEAAGAKEIRVWSAGCAAGEEAYSIAMILHQLIEDRGSEICFRIFATDVSAAALDRARQGRYPLTAVKHVPMGYYQQYFSTLPDGCLLNADVKRFVDFSVHDLLNPAASSPAASIYGDFDVILCCNVLFYYTNEVQQAILRRLKQSLSTLGTLVTGYVERDSVQQSGLFRAVMPQVSVFGCR